VRSFDHGRIYAAGMDPRRLRVPVVAARRVLRRLILPYTLQIAREANAMERRLSDDVAGIALELATMSTRLDALEEALALRNTDVQAVNRRLAFIEADLAARRSG